MKTRVIVRLPTGWQLVELRSFEGVLFGTTWKLVPIGMMGRTHNFVDDPE